MTENKTKPTAASIDSFLSTVSSARQEEARLLIALMQEITGLLPVLWGPSIIGFGTMHYRYETGREGDMPILAFSPRKAAITVYFDSFDHYGEQLARLGKYTSSVSCLYIKKLSDVHLPVLREMLEQCFARSTKQVEKPETVTQYIASVPSAARHQFDRLRAIVASALPDATETLSYGILAYKTDAKRAKVYISGWKDHVALYPIPKDPTLEKELKPYVRGKGTIWFDLNQPLPEALIIKIVAALV